jgi:hypothetical protein
MSALPKQSRSGWLKEVVGMDDRQTQIREGAGLEDSRINEEFLDFLNKWSTPVLTTLAVAALIWAGLQYLERKKVARIDQAFSELDAATQGGNPSPASLKTIAREYKGVRSVPELALLTTTDLYLNAFMVGVKPGTQVNPTTGLPADEGDLLDESQRQTYLEQAGELAQQVFDLSGDVAGKELIAMQAMSRLAAVAEGKRDFDGAKSMYQRLETLADTNHYAALGDFARNRIKNLDGLEGVVPLPTQDQLVSLPGEDIQPTLSDEQIQQMIDSIQNEAGEGASGGVEDLTIQEEGSSESESSTETPAEPTPETDSP